MWGRLLRGVIRHPGTRVAMVSAAAHFAYDNAETEREAEEMLATNTRRMDMGMLPGLNLIPIAHEPYAQTYLFPYLPTWLVPTVQAIPLHDVREGQGIVQTLNIRQGRIDTYLLHPDRAGRRDTPDGQAIIAEQDDRLQHGIMAHEAGHAIKLHSIKERLIESLGVGLEVGASIRFGLQYLAVNALSKTNGLSLLITPFVLLCNHSIKVNHLDNGDITLSLGLNKAGFFNEMAIKRVARSQEREADQLSIQLIIQEHDKESALKILKEMRDLHLSGDGAIKADSMIQKTLRAVFRAHPEPEERATYFEEAIVGLEREIASGVSP